MHDDPFAPWLVRWRLVPDGAAITTRSSRLLPVRHGGRPAMLKLAGIAEEVRGGRLMQAWGGVAAAPVLARRGAALLLARGGGTLAGVPDDRATPILCAVAAGLHAASPGVRLTPLARWFRALAPAAAVHGGVLADSARAARALLAAPREVVALHGDLHHMNVLDFGALGWRAIDPKGLRGERGFEFATLLRNPDPGRALAPGRLEREVARVAGLAGVERERLLLWVMAGAGLSAAWFMADGGDPRAELSLVERVRALLGG